MPKVILRSAAVIIVLFAFAATWLPQPASAQASASDVVERLNDTLLEVMQGADNLGYQGRYEKLAPVLTDSFDFGLMARVALGKHWKGLDQAQQALAVESFGRLSVATFAARFSGYGGEVFEVTGEKTQRKNTMLVKNRLLKRDGDFIPINYLVRLEDGEWRIVDVFLDAKYSELALKRSEYTSVVQREGFDGLIGIIEAKINQISHRTS